MSAVELLTELQRRGVQVTAEGDRLKIKGPRGAVSPELRQRLAASKPAMLAVLKVSSDSEMMALCRRACAGLNVDPARLASFLMVAEDPAWCTERVARHLARRMAEGMLEVGR